MGEGARPIGEIATCLWENWEGADSLATFLRFAQGQASSSIGRGTNGPLGARAGKWKVGLRLKGGMRHREASGSVRLKGSPPF